jgi:GNAT superfamily N-acetyltransferase
MQRIENTVNLNSSRQLMSSHQYRKAVRTRAMRIPDARVLITIPGSGLHRSDMDVARVMELLSVPQPELPVFMRDAKGPGNAHLKDKVQLMMKNTLEVVFAYTEGENRRLVGLCLAMGDGELTATISLLIVHPQWRNQGIGTRLISTMCRLLQSREIYDVGAFVSPSYEASFAQCSFGDDPLGSTLMVHQGNAAVKACEFRPSSALVSFLRTKPR